MNQKHENQGVFSSMLIMTATTNVENLQQYRSRFSFIVKKILAFASGANFVRKVKNLSPNFKRLA